jgi:hypothetical protein
MVRKNAALLVALGLFVSAPPLTAIADDQGVHYEMQTRLAGAAQPGEVDGTLKITIFPSGIVQGQYFEGSQTGSHDVTGGVKGDNIWLHIAALNPREELQLTGTFKSGVLDMTTALSEAGDTAGQRGQVRTFTSVKTTQVSQ